MDFWCDGLFIDQKVTDRLEIQDVRELITERNIEGIIVSTVKKETESFLCDLKKITDCVVVIFNEEEIRQYYKLNYSGHLGPDRMAAVVGANLLWPAENKMVVDLGTAMTIDFTDKEGNFCGGNISLGLKTRMKALSVATSKLPDISDLDRTRSFGNDTESAIQSGAVSGVVGEILYSYKCAYKEFSVNKCILTGGDAEFVFNFLKTEIPVSLNHNLVGLGLDYHLRTHYLIPMISANKKPRMLMDWVTTE